MTIRNQTRTTSPVSAVRRTYSKERYLADLARIAERHDAPALRRLLDETAANDTERPADDEPFPLSRPIRRAEPVPARPTLIGLGASAPAVEPVTQAVLAAMAMGPRPSGRER